MEDGDDRLGLGKGQRAEQDGIDDAEDGGVRADAQGEDGEGRKGKAGAFAQGSDGVHKMLEEFNHRWSLVGGRCMPDASACAPVSKSLRATYGDRSVRLRDGVFVQARRTTGAGGFKLHSPGTSRRSP